MPAPPETAFEDEWTSAFIAARLAEIGVDHIERGIARTGIVATISGRGGAGGSGRAVGLRADFDAPDVTDTPGKPWASTLPGKMRACAPGGPTPSPLDSLHHPTAPPNFDRTHALTHHPAHAHRDRAPAAG